MRACHDGAQSGSLYVGGYEGVELESIRSAEEAEAKTAISQIADSKKGAEAPFK